MGGCRNLHHYHLLMIDTLKFVRAAVDKTGHNPALSCFRIRGGTISANNGHLCIQAPVPIPELDCCPNAEKFIKAVEACEGIISMHLDGGKLVVKSGKFTSKVPTIDPSQFPDYYPSGQIFPLPQPILPILRKLLPFVATDERRKWACGVIFSGNSAYATNSICTLEHWLPVAFPVEANLPREAVSEIVRLKVEPTSLQVSDHAVTFHLPEGAFISSKMMIYDLPDIAGAFARAESYTGQFCEGETLKSLLADCGKILKGQFLDEHLAVHFNGSHISNGPAEEPTTIECTAPAQGIFRCDQLTALAPLVDRMGFDAYPLPVPFYGGEHLRGMIVGYRKPF